MKQVFMPLLLLAGLLSMNEAYSQKKPPAAVNAIMGGAQTDGGSSGSFKTVTASKVMEMKIPEGGANGAAVVYHPKEKLYYAAQAGNKEFPLVIFDADGNVVSSAEQATLIDVRGLWYNPDTKEIAGNGYKSFGWFRYSLTRKGLPESIDIFKEGRFQPDDHSPGVLNTKDDEVLFLDGLNILCYTTKGVDKQKTIQIHVGAKSSDDATVTSQEFEDNYNTRSIIYTGNEGAEIGFLNVTKKQVELYNIKTGYMTKIVTVNLPFTPETFFNFSYSNNIYWFFNKQTRYWLGYKED